MIASSYEDAVEYITASYWVVAVVFPPNKGKDEQKFNRNYRISDDSESGLVHYSKRRGRIEGFSPIYGEGGVMVKKVKAWSMPREDWDWLESQDNQSEAIRDAIAMYRLMRVEKQTT